MQTLHKKRDKGFTLIELIVVIGIFGLLSTVIILSGNDFNNAIILQNMAYEVALSVREAQVYGISVVTGPGDFDSAYGIYFQESTPENYYLFADLNVDGDYDTGLGGDVLLETFSFTRGHQLGNLCGTINGSKNCSPHTIYITFKRPDPNAILFGKGNVGAPRSSGLVYIPIESPEGQIREVQVDVTGQISVKNP